MKTKHLLSTVLCLAAISACGVYKEKKPYVETPPALRLALLPHDAPAPGKTVTVDVKLNDIRNRTILTDKDLDTAHTQKIHLLIIDPTFTDYQHIHPKPTSTPGVYSFQFTPKLPGGYRVWADVTPSATHKQEYVMADLGPRKPAKITIAESREATVDGYRFTLSFDKPPVEGDESLGTIQIADAKGNPVKNLQPVMGSFSHIVGFYDDFRTVVHVHPMGAEPKDDAERGGPELTFHLMPVKPGFIKLFVQVKIGGKDVFVPFGVKVDKEK